jgi:hypothetical protein
MSQTEVQLIKADAVQTGDIANSAVTDAKISALTASKLTGALPAISGASLTNLPASGITMHDSWCVNAGYSVPNGSSQITSNWSRNTTSSFGSIGSAMTESSGLFTFPSTGIYYIYFRGFFYRGSSGDHRYLGLNIEMTTNNNSSDTTVASTYTNFKYIEGNTYQQCAVDYTFDVTDVSTHKVKFSTEALNTGLTAGDIGGRRFALTFTRLGDT